MDLAAPGRLSVKREQRHARNAAACAGRLPDPDQKDRARQELIMDLGKAVEMANRPRFLS